MSNLICVDIDNTICNTNELLIRKFNIKLNKYPSSDIPPEFFDSMEWIELMQYAEPFPYAVQALQYFAELGNRIVYLSERSADSLFATVRWIQKHHFPVEEVMVGLSPDEKLDCILNDFKPIAVFEDDPRIATRLLAIEPQNNDVTPIVWLKDWLYNRKLRAPKGYRFFKWVNRFRSWQEVLQAIVTANTYISQKYYNGGNF